MRLVFPTDENAGYLSKRGAHFGKAKFYTIITLIDNKISDVEGIDNPGHDTGACTNAVTNIINLNPDILIIGGIGGEPAEGFAKAGLKVYADTISTTVEESIKAFVDGNLKEIGSQGTCSVN